MTIPNSLSYNLNYLVYPSGSVDQYYRPSGHKTSSLLTLKNKKNCKLTLRHPWICYFFAIKALKKIDKIQLVNFKTGRVNARPGLPQNVPLDAVLRVLGCLTRPEVVQVSESRVGEGRVTGSAGRARGQRENPDKGGLGDGRPQGSESVMVILWGRHGF